MTRAAKYLTIVLLLLMIGCGRHPESVELKRSNFSEFERKASKITDADIYCFVFKMPATGGGAPYKYSFSIDDKKKIKTIIACIGNAKQPQLPRKHINKQIFFETGEALYEAYMEVTDTLVYGNWWESVQLLENLKRWNLIEERDEGPSRELPPGIERQTRESDPNYPWQKPGQKDFVPGVILTRDAFQKIDDYQVVRIYILCWVERFEPDGEVTKYNYIFTISAPDKVEEILQNIRGGRQTEYPRRRINYRIWFKSRKAFYTTRIWWDDKVVYGEWWESAELLEKFKQWNLLEAIAKADPNRDPPTYNRP